MPGKVRDGHSRPRRKAERLRFERRDGGTVSVRFWPGHGRPLLLVHGFLDSSEGWDSFARTTHRPCYAVDLPGFGASSCPAQGSLNLYADAVVDVADALELDDFVLVGHSLGGAVSALAADQLASRVSSLMLLAPAGFGPLPLAEFANVKPVRDLLSRGLPFALANPVLLNFFYAAQVSGGKPAPWSMQKRMFRNAVRVRHGAVFGVDCLARHSRDVRTGAFAVRPSRYDGPVSVLWGDRDRLVSPKHAENVPLAFPQAKVDIWKGMAHHPQVERPRQLAQWMERSCVRARKAVQERRRRERRGRVTGT